MIVQLNGSLCVGCGCCSDVCSMGALEMTEDAIKLYLEYCVGCGSCIPMCPVGALCLNEG